MLMAQERAKTNFPVREMTYYLNDGVEETEKMESLKDQIERSPKFDNRNYYDDLGDHEKCREETFKKVGAINEIATDGRSEKELKRVMNLMSVLDPQASTRIGVHFGLFLSGVRSGGTPAQLNFWVAQGAGNLKNFFGCFAMTELGHGSNVAGLETTATYDRETEEFIINTPTVAATKWWIGGLAHTASHALCYARLIIDGKDYGVKQFVVPLRNRDNWELLPGIAIGDIGKKLGRDGIDNGWAQFNNVRIPRLFMLAKFSQVHADGRYTQSAPAQLAYGALIGGRVSMVNDSYTWASRFLTIAIRYAAVRRQFAQNSPTETKLLDYTFHQRRLLPRLAYCYAMNAGSRRLNDVYTRATDKLQETNTKDKAALASAVQDIKSLFALSAGLKAFTTWATLQIIDECRQACGGHGYSAYNGFIDWNAFAVQVTWEGDNNILALSSGRALIGSYIQAKPQKVADQTISSEKLEDQTSLLGGWKLVASKAVEQAATKFQQLKASGMDTDNAWEQLSQLRFKTSRISSRAFLVNAFFEEIANAAPGIKTVLTDLATLFALWSIEEESAAFLEFKILPTESLSTVNQLVSTYCGRVRDQAIGLTDSFNWSDFYINAPIGNYNGDVYNNYFRKVTEQNPKSNTKPPYYESTVAPYFKRKDDDEYDLESLEEEEREERA